jgi:hypothetical protein
MKRLSFVLLCGVLINVLALAQQHILEQRGGATRNTAAEGFTAAHPRLALGSKIMVANTMTGKEIEVTITSRILPAANRIVELSPDVWRELDLDEDSIVRIYTIPATSSYNPDTPPPELLGEFDKLALELALKPEDYSAPISRSEKEIAAEDYAANYFSQLYTKTAGSDAGFLAWLTTMMIEAREAREARDIREAREAREVREAREAREYREFIEAREYRDAKQARELEENRKIVNNQFQITTSTQLVSAPPDAAAAPTKEPAAPAQVLPPPRQLSIPPLPVPQESIQIIPCLPDRFSGKKYHLQIGTYSVSEVAAAVALFVKSAGFLAAQEQYGSMYNVLVLDIPAADVYPAIQRLASLGFNRFWVRE